MKDFQIEQKVFIIDKEYFYDIGIGTIIKKFESTTRWKVRRVFDRTKQGIPDVVVERFYGDSELFNSFEEAFYHAMSRFDKEIDAVTSRRLEFIKNIEPLKLKLNSIQDNERKKVNKNE